MSAILEASQREQLLNREVPELAFQWNAGKVQFAASGADGKEAAVTVVARSGEPVEHWYWGRIVHDLAGMRVAGGDKVAFDWCHYEGPLGYGDKFDVTSGSLVISGKLVSFTSDDKAAEVIHKGQRGVPYEASIYYDPRNGLRMEYVPEKMSANVNGRTIEGPVVIVREWLLRGVAICLYGEDPNTSTEFSQQKNDHKIKVSLFTAEDSMDGTPDSKATEATPEGATKLSAAPAAVTVTTPPAEDTTKLRAELGNYVTKFGAENGARWFSEGKSFVEACELHIAAQTTQLAAKDKEIGELKTKLSAVNVGEKDPVSFSSGEHKDEGAKGASETKFAHLGSGLAKFAANIKLPGKK